MGVGGAVDTTPPDGGRTFKAEAHLGSGFKAGADFSARIVTMGNVAWLDLRGDQAGYKLCAGLEEASFASPVPKLACQPIEARKIYDFELEYLPGAVDQSGSVGWTLVLRISNREGWQSSQQLTGLSPVLTPTAYPKVLELSGSGDGAGTVVRLDDLYAFGYVLRRSEQPSW